MPQDIHVDAPSEASSAVFQKPTDKVVVTEEDDARIRKATDKVVLSILCWVYFLQILDKSVVGYSTAFGLREDSGISGTQYSTISAAGYYGQAAIAPLSAFMLVKVPVKILMPVLVFCWGVSLCGMAASQNYGGLLASRTLLGIFEAAVPPLFTIMVSNCSCRRIYSSNGIATILGSLLSFGLGHIKSGPLHSYQIIFLVTGLITVITAPILYFILDNSVAEARFLSPKDPGFKLGQVFEVLIEPKTWLWLGMCILNAGASISNAFGPILLGSFGFDSYTLTLLNMPFGAVQFICIWLASWVAWSTSKKSPILFATSLPPIVGLAAEDRAANLVGYYLLGPLFAANPLIISWIAGNTAGQTKKATIMSLYQAALAGGILLDKPYYYNGIRIVLGFFVAICGLVILQTLNLMFLNKLQKRKRVNNGKPAKLKDMSMNKHFVVHTEDSEGQMDEVDDPVTAVGNEDRTDRENDEIIYVY
ncbi:permease of the major facilitator superfamily [Flagelloscypha sp. PMI_526]|nr:permease of the major facilitator superfamily [Flagelloscypha sp. PMI_526]